MADLRFKWDERKNIKNQRKHGVSFEEAMTVFGDRLGRIENDLRHSADEDRFVLLGISRGQRLLAVMFAERGDAIRLISARPATNHERRDYEENKF